MSILRSIFHTIISILTLPFRLIASLFGGGRRRVARY